MDLDMHHFVMPLSTKTPAEAIEGSSTAAHSRPSHIPLCKSDGSINQEYINAHHVWMRQHNLTWTPRSLVAYVGYDLERQFREGTPLPNPRRDMRNIVFCHRSLLDAPAPECANRAWREVVDVLNPRIKMNSMLGPKDGYPNLCHLAADPRKTEESFLAAWDKYADRWRADGGVNLVLLDCRGAARFQAQMRVKPWQMIAREEKQKREEERDKRLKEEAALERRAAKAAAKPKSPLKSTDEANSLLQRFGMGRRR